MSSAADGSGEGKCGDQCKDSRRGLVMQVVTALSLSMTGFSIGGSLAFTGVFTEQMTADQGVLPLTRSQISWVASGYAIGNTLGCLVSSYVNPRLGTIRLVQLCAPALAGGWLLLALGGDFWTMLAGRTLTGLAVGIVFGPTITYIGEISSVNIRGVLALFFNLMLSFGMLITFLCGWKLGWRHTCLVVGIGPVVVMFLVSLMLPRSAKWLISKGHPVEEAQRSLRFYHGKDYDVDQQIQKIRESLGEEHRHDASLFEVLQLLRHRHYLVPFCLMLCMYVLFVFSGGFTTASFAPVVFKDVGGFSNPYIGSILVGALRVITSIMMSYIVQKSERRTSLMINGVVGGAACLVSGFFFHYSAALADYAWVQLVSVLVIVSAMSLGIAPLTNLLLTELLPNAIRAEAGGILLTFFGTINFIMVYTFPLAVAAVDMSDSAKQSGSP
ncbi:Facilitated trehalose transporter Tret1 [Amphibalanus amphitrite]|uniref:Facilitated trehalose transporter Tret1 n=1 Tax=Amphibalanus amphitrite TaxID=1232801 RepID=A0A6A4X687_AMPAM|nr:Facilitated trehalose transporter Tret1 [Amphibalanus amphitrite]